MRKMFVRNRFALLVLLLIGVLVFAGCQDDKLSRNPYLRIKFQDENQDSVEATVEVLKDGTKVAGPKTGSVVEFQLKEGSYTLKVTNKRYGTQNVDGVVINDEDLSQIVTLGSGSIDIASNMIKDSDFDVNQLGSADNIISNGTFDLPLSDKKPADGSGKLPSGSLDSEGSWSYYQGAGGSGSATIVDGAVKIDVSRNESKYSVQLLQGPVTLTRGSKYKIQFKAKADSNIPLTVKVGGVANVSWKSYAQEDKNLTTEWATYELDFTMGIKTNNNARFEFWLLNPGTYYIDDVSIVKTGEVDLVDEGKLTEADEDKVEDWKLVWEENFDSDSIDSSVWNFELGSPDWNGDGKPDRWGNNELQYYQKDNASVNNSILTIKAVKEEVTDMNTKFNYTSARLTTKDKYEVKYGRMEIRAKLPIGQGIWPAIWMLGNDIDENTWPACGEIDIMEYLGHQPSAIHGTIHGPVSAGPGVGSVYTLESGQFNDDFHVFAIEWDADEVEFYVDNQLYHVVNKQEIGDKDWVFDHPYYFILNLAVGGTWPGNPDETTTFPQTMQVDYIKVYKDTNPDSIDGQEAWDSEYEDNYNGNHSSNEHNDTSSQASTISNGSFDKDIMDKLGVPSNWYVWTGEGGSADEYGVENGEFKIDVAAIGTQSWSIQFAQNLKLSEGDYRVSFKARAEDDRDIVAMVQEDGGSWTVYGQANPDLSSDMIEYSFDVSMSGDNNPKLIFSLGKTKNGIPTTIYIDDVSIEKVK